jgi:DNA-3-methyladenine glycosylase II
MSDDEIIQEIVAIKGIGRWTVEMLLIFTLGRPDVLPAADLGVRKGFAIAYRKKAMPTPGEILAHGEKWRPYRTTATLYLYEAVHATEPIPGVKLVRKTR